MISAQQKRIKNPASVKQRAISGAFKILIPLYATYLIFAASLFFFFIPQQRHQLTEQKKLGIQNLTDSTVSLLADYDARIKTGELSLEAAQKEAVQQIRNMRFGPEGKDYFWINDLHPFMIMHPYRPDLEGKDLTLFTDAVGNYPFIGMVEKVMNQGAGFVNYYWQWKDDPERILPKISYVKEFPQWGWIIGTGVYEADIEREIAFIQEKFTRIFIGILIFVILLSIYISTQVFRIEQKRAAAEQARALDQLRLKTLFELSQLTGSSEKDITEFAVEQAIELTRSRIGYLAFVSPDEANLTMHTWSEQAMKECRIKDKTLIYAISETGLWARAAWTRQPDVVNNYPEFDSPEKKGCPRGHIDVARMMSIPIFEDQKMVAIAGVGNKFEDYDESDIRQLQLMMDGMWKILQRNRAQEQLRESEARYRILADNATDMISVLDLANQKPTYVSPAVKPLLGFTPEAYCGMALADLLSPSSFDAVTRLIARELELDGSSKVDPDRYQILELELLDSQGNTIWAEVTARFLRTSEGRPDRILGITRDISQRKKLEAKLRQANEDLKLAQEIAGVGSWSLEIQSGRMIWSEEIYRIFERDPALGPCSREALEACYEGSWREIFSQATNEAMEQGVPYDLELVLTLPSGRHRWIHAICTPEMGSTGSPQMLRGTFQDITERKNLESRIQQSQKMEALGTLAGGIAHDFNNILSFMMGFTELAKLKLKGQPDIRTKLDQVLTGGLRARDLIKHILIFSRKADVQKSDIEIGPLLKESLKFLRASLPPNIDIRQDLSDTETTILADATQMHQVLMNLFTNAAHAMKESGGILYVSLAAVTLAPQDKDLPPNLTAGPYLRLTIGDTGPGIPRSIQDKIFEPFFTTKARGEGTGMGLSLVYGIIKEMKGAISVYSEPGMGSTFRILLPVMTGEKKMPPSGREETLPTGSGRILLVDDEAPIINWTRAMLEELGYKVDGFHDPVEALAAFKEAPDLFDLVITDLAMPEMTGLELADSIKSLNRAIPIVLSTGFSAGLTPSHLSEHGISDMVMKPMIASELARAVRLAITSQGESHDPDPDHR